MCPGYLTAAQLTFGRQTLRLRVLDLEDGDLGGISMGARLAVCRSFYSKARESKGLRRLMTAPYAMLQIAAGHKKETTTTPAFSDGKFGRDSKGQVRRL